MKHLIATLTIVAALPACSDPTPTTEAAPTTTVEAAPTTTQAEPVPPVPDTATPAMSLEDTAQARSAALLANEGVDYFSYFSERCRQAQAISDIAGSLNGWHIEQDYLGISLEGAVSTVEITDGDMAKPTMYTADGDLLIEGNDAPWVIEDGEWKHDGC